VFYRVAIETVGSWHYQAIELVVVVLHEINSFQEQRMNALSRLVSTPKTLDGSCRNIQVFDVSSEANTAIPRLYTNGRGD